MYEERRQELTVFLTVLRFFFVFIPVRPVEHVSFSFCIFVNKIIKDIILWRTHFLDNTRQP